MKGNLFVAAIVAVAAAFVLTGEAGAESDIHPFDIDAGDAEDAIDAFSRQSKRLIVVPGDALLDVGTPAVHGVFSPAAALSILLKDTGLEIVSDDGRTVVLSNRAAPHIGVRKIPTHGREGMEPETVVVTSYRAGLANATRVKRESVSFVDSIFAEDIGKFPDTNIAESFNRVPGISISREVTGEGINISIRSLGTNFTNVLLNSAPVGVASTGRTDAQNANREVDLNMFPMELFAQLSVSKSPTAGLIEGGAAGTVNMRSARPFDRPGFRLSYSVQGQINTTSGKLGENGMLIVSNTWDDTFGVFVGLSAHHNLVRTHGFETIGWTNPNLSAAQCGAASGCNATGGGNWTIPATAPVNASTTDLGIAGATIDKAWLLAHNPALTSITQLDDGLLPRLGRPSDQTGHRDRVNAVASLEYRPADNLHFYLDSVFGRTVNQELRTDMMFQVRNSGIIPIDVEVDSSGIVSKGTFANEILFLELRPFVEKGDFQSVNPGMEWKPTALLKVDLKANATRSHFFRDYPTVGLFTNPTTVSYEFNKGYIPTFTSTIALNDVHNWGWSNERAIVAQEKRYTYNNGVHLDVSYGGEEERLTAGAAYDDAYRSIGAAYNSAAWQAALFGNYPSPWLRPPNTPPVCEGSNIIPSPPYPGYGTGYTAGMSPVVCRGSLIPNSEVYRFLRPGTQGYATIDWPAFRKAANYDEFSANAPFANTTITGAKSGTIFERIIGLYTQLDGTLSLADRELRYNIGLRWIEAHQMVGGFTSNVSDPRNATLTDGGFYPDVPVLVTSRRSNQAFLPSANVVWHATEDAQIRLSLSRTMTRPDPSAMLPGVNFSSASADVAFVGNPALHPFYSTNMDIGAEYYTGGEGYLGFAAFRKRISGYTETETNVLPFSTLDSYGITYGDLSATQRAAIDSRGGPTLAPVVFNTRVNSSGLLTVNGVEFNWVQPLDFALERYGLEGFGFTANATFIDQSGSDAALAAAIGVPKNTYNLVGYYESDGLIVRLSFVSYGRIIDSLPYQNGVVGARLYIDPYDQLDLSTSYKLSRLLGMLPSDPALTIDIQNVTGSSQRSYFEIARATYSYYEPGTAVLFGIRGTF